MKALKVFTLLLGLMGGTGHAEEFLLGSMEDSAPAASQPTRHRKVVRPPAPKEDEDNSRELPVVKPAALRRRTVKKPLVSAPEERTQPSQPHFPNIFGLLNSFAGHSCEHVATQGNELLCMACNAFLEAGNQSSDGQVQVDRTVMTRKSRGWGKSACEIIYQRKQYSWTWITPKKQRRLPKKGEQLVRAVTAAQKALQLKGNGATHYYANYIGKPSWARSSKCHYSKQVGVHKFYSCMAELETGDPTRETPTQLADEEPSDVTPAEGAPRAPETQMAELIGSDSAS